MSFPRRAWLRVAYALLALSALKNVANPDIFWHLSAGNLILSTGHIPRADWLSFTRAGVSWIDFEWLAQVVIAGLHRLGGWWALILLKAAAMILSAAVVARAMEERGIGPDEQACGLAVLVAGWTISNDVRPDWISILLLCVELSWLERLRCERVKPNSAAVALGAAAAAAFWANAHAGFALGLAAAGVYAILCRGSARKALVAAFAGGFLGTLLTPFGPRLYSVLLDHGRAATALSRYIVEWRWSTPLNAFVAPAWLLFAGLALTAWHAPPRRRELAPWAVLAGLAALAAMHQRHVPYFIVAGVLLAPLLLAARTRFSLPRACAPVLLLLAAVFQAMPPQALSASGLQSSDFPSGAADFLAARPDVARLRLYNPWCWGGYLGWRLAPAYRVYYDGRYIFHDLLGPSIEAENDAAAWQRFLEEQRLDGALMTRNRQDSRTMPPDHWALLYKDNLSALYVRRSKEER